MEITLICQLWILIHDPRELSRLFSLLTYQIKYCKWYLIKLRCSPYLHLSCGFIYIVAEIEFGFHSFWQIKDNVAILFFNMSNGINHFQSKHTWFEHCFRVNTVHEFIQPQIYVGLLKYWNLSLNCVLKYPLFKNYKKY